MCRCICGRGESTERSCTWEHSFPLHSGVPGPTGHYVESKETEAARPEARAGVMAGVRCWAVARRPCWPRGTRQPRGGSRPPVPTGSA